MISAERLKPKVNSGTIGLDFKEVNKALDIEEVGKALGLELKNHYCKCPFHQERTPSMRFYKDHYYCFSCGAHGDAINLMAEIKGIRQIEAVSELNGYFHLGLDLQAKPVTKAADELRETQSRRNEYYKKWYTLSVRLLSDYIQKYAKMMYTDSLSPRIRYYASQEVEGAESLQDALFQYGPEESYKRYRNEVDQIKYRMQKTDEWAY